MSSIIFKTKVLKKVLNCSKKVLNCSKKVLNNLMNVSI